MERLATTLAVVFLKLTIDERVQNGRGHTAETAKIKGAKLQTIRYRPDRQNDCGEEDEGLEVRNQVHAVALLRTAWKVHKPLKLRQPAKVVPSQLLRALNKSMKVGKILTSSIEYPAHRSQRAM